MAADAGNDDKADHRAEEKHPPFRQSAKSFSTLLSEKHIHHVELVSITCLTLHRLLSVVVQNYKVGATKRV